MDKHRRQLENLLKTIVSEQKLNNPTITITPVSSEGANYTSKLYSITIKDAGKDLKLFSKVMIMGETLRAQAPLIYEIETYVYSKLAKVYEKLEDECAIPAENKLAFAKYYGGNSKMYEEVIVLEDLVAQGFKPFDRFKSIDWPYASASVEELAKMHALSIAYRHANPKEYKEVVADLKLKMGSYNTDLTFCFSQVNEAALNNVRIENKDKLKAYFDRFDMAGFRTAKTWVLVHSDFRPSNLLHRDRQDGTVEIKITDLQTIQEGSPVTDLLYFIFMGSDQQFRAVHYERLVEHYYKQLSAAMARLRLQPDQIYSREDFYSELKEKLHYGLAIAVFGLQVITVEEQNAPVVTDVTDMSDFFVMKPSALYGERLNGVVDDFVTWGVL